MIFTQLMLDRMAASTSAYPIDAAGAVGNSSPGSTAVIDIFGPLVHRNAGMIGWLSGDGASYSDIRDLFSQAMSNDVGQIVFNIDSPGGEVAGVFDLADMIYQARGKKPITAIANESALSAAYLIASAADHLYLTRTASVGSIGVMALHVDQSEAEKNAGLNVTAIYAGERKNDFSPHGPLTEAAFNLAQEKVNATYDLFVSTVARNRSIPESAVRKTQAAIYTGEEAISIGLADRIQSFNQLISRGTQMNLKAEVKALFEGKTPEEIAEAMADFMPQPTDQTDRSKEILAIAELAGVTDLGFVMGLVNDGIEPEKARTIILEAKADQAKKHIFSTVSATGIGDVNVLIRDAQKRAGKEGK